MGKRGPKPKPTALRIINGNPSNRPFNDREPKPTARLPEPPDFLSSIALEEWKRVGPQLERLRLMSDLDRAALSIYCQAWGRYVEAELALADPEIVEKRRRMLLIESKDAATQVRNYIGEFGLSPASRSSLQVPATEDLPAVNVGEKKAFSF